MIIVKRLTDKTGLSIILFLITGSGNFFEPMAHPGKAPTTKKVVQK